MKYISLFLLVFLFWFSAIGQSTVDSLYRALKASAQAGNLDNAFQLLAQLTASDQVSIADSKNIESDKDLVSLQGDTRWKGSMEQLKKRASANYSMTEIVYGRKDGIALTMLHLKPRSKPNGKAIVSVIAGSWFSSYQTAERTIRPSLPYLDKGFALFLVIVGSQPRYTIPDQVADLKRAVRYIRYNASDLMIDSDHIGITGSSAGGHLALVIATADDKIDNTATDPVNRVSARVQAAAVLFPPTDFLNWGTIGGNMPNAGSLLKAASVYGAFEYKNYSNTGRYYEIITDTTARNKISQDISPIYAVSPDDPPIFIIHGDADPTVPLQQSQTFVAKLKESGITNNYIIKKGAKHNANDMIPEIYGFTDWFEKYLK